MDTQYPDIRASMDGIYRRESRRILATLIRLLGDFTLAEEALHSAFTAALEQWPQQGIPDNPRAWLVSTGRFKAIDTLRQRSRFDAAQSAIAERLYAAAEQDPIADDEDIEDDQLRLIFTCCHPALATNSRVALTLREVCGMTTEAIARAFLVPTPTVAQRIVRAKTKIRDAAIPYEVPEGAQLPERLEAVLQVIYLLYNEGYSPSSGDTVIHPQLSTEAIRLGELLLTLQPEPETMGLQALMLLLESRREARTDSDGDLVLLADQDRSRWDAALIARGSDLVERALRTRCFGPYCLQAAIAAVHAEAASPQATDWRQIVGLYDVLMQLWPTPVVALNRAVAVGMRDGPQAALELVEQLLEEQALRDYHLAHATYADLCRQLNRRAEAETAYRRALSLARQEPERRFLEKRLAELTAASPADN